MSVLLLSTILCFCYIWYIKYKYDVGSISESYYMFKNIGKYGKYIFLVWMVTICVTLIYPWLIVSDTPTSIVMSILTLITLPGVAIWPDYKGKDKFTHFFIAIIALIFCSVWYYAEDFYYISLFIYMFIPVVALMVFKKPQILYWAEILIILLLYIGIYIKIFIN